MPPTPAAGSMWPMLDFSEPTRTGSALLCPGPKTAAIELISIGSPSGVPVPCASTYWTSPGPSRAADSAARITVSWAVPFGTVSPALSPSWPIAEPRTTPTTVSPSRRASDSRLSTSTPQPSARA
jgi:hypothetical protein